MTIEELELHLSQNQKIESLFGDIGFVEPTIYTNTYPNGFTTKKYYSLLTYNFARMHYDLDNHNNILIGTSDNKLTSIPKKEFLTMFNDRSKVHSIIEKLIHVETIDYSLELGNLENEISDLSVDIKSKKEKLEKLINKKHSLLNEQSN